MVVKGKRNARRSVHRVMSSAELRRRNRRVMADDDIEEIEDVEDFDVADTDDLEDIDDFEDDDTSVDVAPEASELLFEAQDVAELIAEVTAKPVEVTADEDTVVFSVDGTEYTVESDGEEEVLESRRVSGRPIRSSRRMTSRKPVKASTARRPMARTARKPVKAAAIARRAVARSAKSSKSDVMASRRVRRTARRVER